KRVGLWRMGTDLSSPTLMHKLTRFGQTWTVVNGKCSIDTSSTSYGEAYLPGDLEGLSLYRAGTGSGGYLFFSNQNASTFGVFDRDGVARAERAAGAARHPGRRQRAVHGDELQVHVL